VPDVRALILPRSVAVVGASPRNPAAVETVVRSGVPAWGVSPTHAEVAGLRCYTTIADLPEQPETAAFLAGDLVGSAAPAEAAPQPRSRRWWRPRAGS